MPRVPKSVSCPFRRFVLAAQQNRAGNHGQPKSLETRIPESNCDRASLGSEMLRSSRVLEVRMSSRRGFRCGRDLDGHLFELGLAQTLALQNTPPLSTLVPESKESSLQTRV